MTPEHETTQDTGDDAAAADVAHGVTNEPRGTGDRDEEAIAAGEERLEQAAGGH